VSRKPASPAHGTRACYLKGCRRPECRAAAYAAKISRERAIVRGDWAPFTDAGPVREHVAALIAAGLTEKNVADLAGVAPGCMFHLLHGSPARRVRRETARAILAVAPPAVALPAAGEIDATGTRRRVQALVACGWPQAWLARELGVKPANLSAMMRGFRGQSLVRASTAAAVRALYDRLWDVPPPQNTPRAVADVGRARALAAAKGWVPPLGWDDDKIDDPSARPAVRVRRQEVA
jgi:hypothetical protein